MEVLGESILGRKSFFGSDGAFGDEKCEVLG